MIFQIFVILLACFFAIKSKIENSILLIVFLLPFHYLLKCIAGFFLGSSSIISLWKEAIFLILFIRILTEGWSIRKKTVHSFPAILLFVFFLLEIALFLLSPNKGDALMSLKVYLFPFMVAFVCANMKVGDFFFDRLMRRVMISVFLVCVIGHIQRYVLNVPFAFLTNIAEGFDANGDLLFVNTASLILDLQRMYGSFAGPNELGLFLAIIISFLVYFQLRIVESRRDKFIVGLVTFFAVITLIQTFSRISWAYAAIFFVATNIKSMANRNRVAIAALTISVTGIFFITTDFGRVFIESITFQEASAQARPEEFFSGLKVILDNPMGFGLGTVQYASANQKWGTEIFWWLVLAENGILIGLLLFLFYLYFALKSYATQNILSRFSTVAIIITILAGFASVIVFEPIFLTFLWMFVGMGLNKAIVRNIPEARLIPKVRLIGN